MNNLQLNPANASGSVDRPVLVPELTNLSDAANDRVRPSRSLRRRAGAVRMRPLDSGLRLFRVY